MRLALVGLFGDDGEEVQVHDPDAQAGFLEGFARGAFERRLARGHLQLAADGAPVAEVGRLAAEDEELLARRVFNEDEDADLVGEDGGHAVGGRVAGASARAMFFRKRKNWA